ncbi:MAG: sigma factor-like helix-turn-helix DNA-binding protein, partial [Singulisphaera sp.]
ARLVNEAVAGLSPPLRAVVVLHYTGGLSLRQVAAATGASIGTVKSRLNAGLERLRRRLP